MIVEHMAHYGNLLEAHPGLAQAACATWCHGVDVAEAARRLGADLTTARTVTFAQAESQHYAAGYQRLLKIAVLGPIGGWVLAVEPNGFQGSRPEVLRRLSGRAGRAINVFWNVNADNQIVYAEDGTVLTRFDMLFPENREGAEPRALDNATEGVPWDAPGGGWKSAALYVAERVTETRLDTTWLRARHMSVTIRG